MVNETLCTCHHGRGTGASEQRLSLRLVVRWQRAPVYWRWCFVSIALWAASAGAVPDSAPAFRCDGPGPERSSAYTVRTRLAEVPVLLRIPPQIGAPPIVLWHGFGAPASAAALLQALPLDNVPSIKVYPDLPLFGQRLPDGGAAELARRQSTDFARQLFAPAVLGAVDELPRLVADLVARGCLQQGEAIALFGFSAGGAAVLTALAERPVAVRAAVVLNASTGLRASVAAYEHATGKAFDWTASALQVAKRSDGLARHAAMAQGDPAPALLILHGADDPVLGPQVAEQLYAALRPDYRRQQQETRLKLRLLNGLGHGWTEAPQAARVQDAVTAWFNRLDLAAATR